MQPRISPLNIERKEWNPQELVDRLQYQLQEHDRSAGTVKKGCVARNLRGRTGRTAQTINSTSACFSLD